jgi:hypothetical protein
VAVRQQCPSEGTATFPRPYGTVDFTKNPNACPSVHTAYAFTIAQRRRTGCPTGQHTLYGFGQQRLQYSDTDCTAVLTSVPLLGEMAGNDHFYVFGSGYPN